MSDFEWFSDGFNFSMFNMFTYFHHILLISEVNSCPILMFSVLISKLRTCSTRIWAEIAIKGPLRHLKMAEMPIFGKF